MWYTQPGKVRCFEKLKKERLFTNRQLLTLLWPLIIEQALEILVGMADTVMVSSVGEAAISGVSLVDMINQLIITLFGALATGGAVVTSQHLGAKRREEAAHSAGQLVTLSAILGVGVAAFCLITRTAQLRLFFGTITGSKDPLRSRGTAISTGPLTVVTVFVVAPLRELPDPRPAGSPAS